MKWNRYATLCATNNVVATCLDDLVGPLSLRHGGTHPDFTLKGWVEQRLKYVAIRPWSNLNMSFVRTEGDYLWHNYTIFFHIEGEERRAARARGLVGDDNTPLTIGQTLSYLVGWHGLYWAQQPDRPLVFDAVAMKKSTATEGETYSLEAIEIWLPPKGFQP